MNQAAFEKENNTPRQMRSTTLRNGQKMPVIGMGTFGSDKVSASEVADAVEYAAAVGFRFFDCAAVYGNEDRIGKSFRRIMQKGIERESLFVTSKVWNDQHHNVVASCKKSLHDLKLDYLDLYLVHWPFANFHPPGCTVDSRSPDARPYEHARYMDTWQQMESLVNAGLVKGIGTSNMTIPKLDLLLRDCRIAPVANEMECHPHFQQQALFDYLTKRHIQPVGFCPIGSPQRPERDRTVSDTCDIEDPVLVRIAARLNVHPAVVCLKWAMQRGVVPIPFSVSQAKILSNLNGVFSPPLTEQEMNDIATIECNNRLIKGQVFLWEGATGWEDLWDLDGYIVR